MRSFAFVAGLFVVAAVGNSIEARGGSDPCDENACPCMTLTQATTVANNFRDLIVAYSDAKANKYLTVDFVDYSDSVSELINNGCPTGLATLGQPTFDSRASFEAGQGKQPSIPFKILKIWHTCESVFMRWRSNMDPEEVTGIIALDTTCTKNTDEPFKINTAFSEFNSGAWLVDLGVFKPTNCSSS